METLGKRLDDATYWTYAAEKGATIFAIYGVGDGTENTPLYASGGQQAMEDGRNMRDYLEGKKDGAKSRAEAIDRLLKHIKNQ